jgi:hypothetical protein
MLSCRRVVLTSARVALNQTRRQLSYEIKKVCFDGLVVTMVQNWPGHGHNLPLCVARANSVVVAFKMFRRQSSTIIHPAINHDGALRP